DLAALRGDRGRRGLGLSVTALLDRTHHDPLQDERDDGHGETHEPPLDPADAFGPRRPPRTGAVAHTPTRSASGAAGSVGTSVGTSATGTVPEIVVPAPGAVRRSNVPPIAARRSATPSSPPPVPTVVGSKPCPSSVTANVRAAGARVIVIVASDAPAYFATFWRASRHEKYTAASTSCGNRPTPSASTRTGNGAFRACASSADPSPLSASSGG